MDIQGIEPWTSRMRSVRATTVPNAHTLIGLFGLLEQSMTLVKVDNVRTATASLPRQPMTG